MDSNVIVLMLGFFGGGLLGYVVYLRGRLRSMGEVNGGLKEEIREVRGALEGSQDREAALRERHSALLVEKSSLARELLEKRSRDEEAHKQLLLQFENLSNKVLSEKSDAFSKRHKEELSGLLGPLSEKIKSFREEVSRTHRESLNQKVALRTELERMHSLNQRMSKEAHDLTAAIKGDKRLQGTWGEFILERILTNAGLVKGREYVVQDAFTDDEGNRKQPDVVVKLPEEKSIVIDAKVSLKAYEKYFHSEDEELREKYLQEHLVSVRRHIKGLHEKNYGQAYNLKSLDFVVMFIPLEPAFSLALQRAPEIFEEGYHKNVILVSPSTLLATLRTIAHVWRKEHQNMYAAEIAQQSGALYDKFVNFVEDLRKVGAQLTTTQKSYLSAMNKLSEGQGNLISKAEKIKALGARTKKALKPSSK